MADAAGASGAARRPPHLTVTRPARFAVRPRCGAAQPVDWLAGLAGEEGDMAVPGLGAGSGDDAGAPPARRAVPNVRIERLCWLAVRGQLARRGRVNPLLTVSRVGSLAWVPLRGRAAGTDADWLGADPVSGRMRSFAFAVYDVARQLSAAERQQLRRTGQVPEWFIAAVYRRRRELRRRRSRGLLVCNHRRSHRDVVKDPR